MSLTVSLAGVDDTTDVRPVIYTYEHRTPIGGVMLDDRSLSISSADPAQLRRVAEAFTRAADDLDLALVVHSEQATA
jgi:hypothetical protein